MSSLHDCILFKLHTRKCTVGETNHILEQMMDAWESDATACWSKQWAGILRHGAEWQTSPDSADSDDREGSISSTPETDLEPPIVILSKGGVLIICHCSHRPLCTKHTHAHRAPQSFQPWYSDDDNLTGQSRHNDLTFDFLVKNGPTYM